MIQILWGTNISVDSFRKSAETFKDNMGNEFFELCHESLAGMLKEKGITQAELAHRLRISKKTIQRWINRTTRRISRDTLNQLATALETSTERLTRSAEKIQVRPFNQALKELTSEEFLLQMRLNNDWASYRRILSSFPADEIPSQQQVVLYKNLGIANLYLGKLRAGKIYLEKSIAIAKTLGDQDNESLAYSWLAVREEMMGNLDGAMTHIKHAEANLNLNSSPIALSTFYFLKGRIFFHAERYEECTQAMKQAICESYNGPPMTRLMSGIFYLHLAWAHLREKNYAKARSSLKRALHLAEKMGWVRGQAVSQISLAMITRFETEHCPSIQTLTKKSKQLNKMASKRPLDTRLEQVEFIHEILTGNFERAKDLATHRMTVNAACPLYSAYATLDGLFLSKMKPNLIVVRSSTIEKAENMFRENNLTRSLRTLRFLMEAKEVTAGDFLEHYIF